MRRNDGRRRADDVRSPIQNLRDGLQQIFRDGSSRVELHRAQAVFADGADQDLHSDDGRGVDGHLLPVRHPDIP